MNAFYSKMNGLQVNEFIRMLYIDISGISTTIFITLIALKSSTANKRSFIKHNPSVEDPFFLFL